MADEPTGLEYFKQSDAWKDAPQYADWDKIDLWVEQGKLTEEDRVLLHAAGSMAVLSPEGGGSFPEVDAALQKYYDLNESEDDLDTYDDVTYTGPESDDPIDLNNDSIKPPPDVPVYDGSQGGAIVVSTEAMKTFVARITELNGPMETSYDLLKDVKIEPGGFAEAWELENKIEAGETGLVPATSLFIGKVRDNLVLVTDACNALIKEYTNAEEFNKLSGDKLNEYVGNLRTGLTGMGGEGTTPPPA